MLSSLAFRRKASEKPEEGQNEESNGSPASRGSDAVKKPWERANSSDKSSAGSRVRPIGSTSDAESGDFDRMKQPLEENSLEWALHSVYKHLDANGRFLEKFRKDPVVRFEGMLS
ncbi:hypothetical protein NFI96_034400 [Prochilodus magdalenae]|nr:hypothetical protein NFI96_034400 [Prochilodus magdalenae]